ncbi:MAG TPA: acetate/propionate family kinase [Myxococcaceae bacterium]|jgi:acetate kinase|nr:acetate/propionate family kinase [Myxococcaceae bacterium]
MKGCIAVLNAGSSSIKFALYEAARSGPALFRGQIEQLGVSPHLRVTNARGERVTERRWPAAELDHRSATREIVETAVKLIEGRPVLAVGHRVVHGGTRYAAPIRVDATVLSALRTLVPLAPLHQPHNISAIEAIAEASPQLPQVACFDTAFHRTQSELAQTFALPRKLTGAGVRRYGFHGLSYEYVTSRLGEVAPELARGRVVVAHLGNGASLCAIHRGRSVASTMGFTAVDGLMMGTRCGAIDPGVLLYLMDELRMDARAIEDLIYRQSGLLGVSGISSDMRTLRASAEPAAAEAIALFVYRIVREVGSLSAALGGLDGLVFTAGIGERDPATRAEVAAGCGWLGLRLDDARNAQGSGRISADASTVSAWVIPTDEERMIARHTSSVLGLG